VLQAGLNPTEEHVWCGATCVPLGPLAPGAAAEVALQVAVFKPGVYVLDDYRVDWVAQGLGLGARQWQGSKVGEATVLEVDAL